MAAGGNSDNISLGPGRLYYAPYGTAEPTSASAAVPSAWKIVGYTEEGTSVSTDITSQRVEVAEEFDAVANLVTGRVTTVTFAMAEAMVSKLAFALGAGATRTDNAQKFEFPAPDAMVDIMLLWDFKDDPTDADNRRWIFRKCRPSGTIEIANRKAPAKRTIPVTFECATPSGVQGPVAVYPSASGEI